VRGDVGRVEATDGDAVDPETGGVDPVDPLDAIDDGRDGLVVVRGHRSRVPRLALSPVDGEVANNYRVLADDAVSEGDRIQLRRRLEGAGIDVDALLDDFVTYQAIRSYLKDIRDVTYDHESATTTESVRERVDRLVGRTESVVDGQIAQLRSNGDLPIDDFRVLVDVQVYCEGCNTQYKVATLLEDGGCDCEE
jgi:hypothetical protein